MATQRRSPARGKSAKSTKVAADVLAPVDPGLKRAWDNVAATLDLLASKGASAFDELWESTAYVVDHEPPLYLFGGYKTAGELFEQRLHVDTRTAQRNMRVARYATPGDEARYGTTNLDAALGYLEAKYGKLDGTLPVAFARLRIAVVDGKDRKLVPFPELSAPQIAAATRALLAKKSPAPKNPTRVALEAALARHAALSRVVVHERDGLATFANVPVASLGLFGGAISKTKLPAPRAPHKKRK